MVEHEGHEFEEIETEVILSRVLSGEESEEFRRRQGPTTQIRATGICGEWGCPMTYRGRTIKGCFADEQEDGTYKHYCVY